MAKILLSESENVREVTGVPFSELKRCPEISVLEARRAACCVLACTLNVFVWRKV